MPTNNDMPVRLVVRLPQTYCTAGPQALVDVAQAAEELGFYGLSVQDHIIANSELSSCGENHRHDGEDRDVYEALQTLGFVAAHTNTIKLITGILVVPFRHAVLLAKEIAALDVFCNGRFVAGVGVGAPRLGKVGSGGNQDIGVHARVSEQEFSAFKVKGHRGKITDETLQVMDAIWTQDAASFHGEYYDFEDLAVYPKPLQKPRPPFWIGGRSEAAQRRAIDYAEGWIPSQISANMFRDAVAWMKQYANETGRPMPADLGTNIFVALGNSDEEAHDLMVKGFGARFSEDGLQQLVISGAADTFTAKMQRFVDAGVGIFDMKLVPITIDATIKQMERIAEDVAPALTS